MLTRAGAMSSKRKNKAPPLEDPALEGLRIMIKTRVVDSLMQDKAPTLEITSSKPRGKTVVKVEQLATAIPGLKDPRALISNHRRIKATTDPWQQKINKQMARRRKLQASIHKYITRGDGASLSRPVPMEYTTQDGETHNEEVLAVRIVKEAPMKIKSTLIDACIRDTLEEMAPLLTEALELPPLEDDVDEYGVPNVGRFRPDLMEAMQNVEVDYELAPGKTVRVTVYQLFYTKLKMLMEGRKKRGEFMETTTRYKAVTVDEEAHGRHKH